MLNAPVASICIMGAGPIGLYAAIQLKKAGVENLTLIDPRAGIYTRPGTLNHGVFEEIGAKLGFKLWCRSGAMHIKELERQLYQIAMDLDIQIIRDRFVSLTAAGSILIEGPQGERELPCDLAIDCTGPQRAVVHSVNQLSDSKPFTIARVAENPIKNHFMAYVQLSPEGMEAIHKTVGMTSLGQVKTMTEMQELGWAHFHYPQISLFNFGKNKISLYCEIPPDLSEEQQEIWVKKVLQLKTGRRGLGFTKIETSRKYGSKPRFLNFILDPHYVLEPVFLGNEQMPTVVIPAGDALIEPDYRLGIGVINGANRIDALISTMSIQQGKIFSLAVNQYQQIVARLIADQKEMMDAYYEVRKEKQLSGILIDHYRKAVNQARDEEEERRISLDFEKVQSVVAQKSYEKVLQELQAKQNAAKKEDELLKIKKLLRFGETAFEKGYYEESENGYRTALAKALNYFPSPDSQVTVIKVYKHLLQIARKKNDRGKICLLVEEVQPYLPVNGGEELIEHLKHIKADALLVETLASDNNSFFGGRRVLALLKEASKVLQTLKNNATQERLEQKFAIAAAKYGFSEAELGGQAVEQQLQLRSRKRKSPSQSEAELGSQAVERQLQLRSRKA